MKTQLNHQIRVSVDRNRVIGRRDILKAIPAGLAAGALPWTDLMSTQAGELRKRGMSCILLWMQGGPSQFETFSPKPGHANGGETKAISTSVPGIEVAQNLPHLAKVMDEVAVIRSMTSKEGSHRRASFLLHTGNLPTPTVKYPTLGSTVLHEIGDPECELPGFVKIGGRGFGGGGETAGMLGVEFDPFSVQRADSPPTNAELTTDSPRYLRRLGLLDRLEANYAAVEGKQAVADHRKLYDKASRMVLSSDMQAFDLEQESSQMRDAYGRTQFGSGCLLARRLIEAGVTFVEVQSGGWDTHFDVFNRVKALTDQIDQPAAQLIRDLREREMLDNTLIIWMGEFGRTPRINPRGGRDHYPRAFNVALAGGGIRGGQVIGKTVAGGESVEDRPVAVNDLFQSISKTLHIDPDREHMSPIGRPIKNVDGGEAIEELFS